MFTPSDFGSQVRARRCALRMSQEALARAVGISQPWLARIELGRARKRLPVDVLCRLAAVLDLPRRELLAAGGYDPGILSDVPDRIVLAGHLAMTCIERITAGTPDPIARLVTAGVDRPTAEWTLETLAPLYT